MKYNFRDFTSLLVYVLRYLFKGKERSILLQPIDAANGVVMSDIDDDGIMRGLTIGGNRIEIPFKQFLSIEPQYDVSRFTGQRVKTERCDEERLGEILEQSTNKDTGEVDSSIREIKEVGKPENKVTRWLWEPKQ